MLYVVLRYKKCLQSLMADHLLRGTFPTQRHGVYIPPDSVCFMPMSSRGDGLLFLGECAAFGRTLSEMSFQRHSLSASRCQVSARGWTNGKCQVIEAAARTI